MIDRTLALQQIESIIGQTLKQPDVCITEQSTAKDIKGWDSLSHMTVMVAIEEQFNIKFSFMEMINMSNVGSMIDCLLEKL